MNQLRTFLSQFETFLCFYNSFGSPCLFLGDLIYLDFLTGLETEQNLVVAVFGLRSRRFVAAFSEIIKIVWNKCGQEIKFVMCASPTQIFRCGC